MDTVSQKYYIRLDKNLQCETICSYVQNLVTKFQQSNQDLSNSFLCLDVKQISNDIDSSIVLLEYNSPT
jgi:hypothetical protein